MSSRSFRVGIQLQPQHCTLEQLRKAWKAADALQVDSLWTWDHFYPLYGDAEGSHFECWTILAAMAESTSHARFGALVSSIGYRNPDLIADMSRTIDHISGGRFILGLGAGWFERDYDEYGYEFGDAPARLRTLRDALPRIRARLEKLNPPAVGPMPIMIGGAGEKVTLRLTAQYAQMWNTFPPLFPERNQVLNEWCEKLGRDPGEIDRTVSIDPQDMEATVARLREAGAQHFILRGVQPFDMKPVEQLLRLSEA